MKLSKVDRILKGFHKKKIVVFGDVGLDQYTVGKVSRISPEAPIPVVEVTSVHFKLGLAANVADNVAALGGTPLLVGLTGKDHGAESFCSLLKHSKVGSQYLVEDSSRPTTLKERVVAETQQVVRIDHETRAPISGACVKAAELSLKKAMAQADCLVIEDYAKGFVSPGLVRLAISEATRRDLPVLVDPNSKSPLRLYQGCTLMTPNTSEAEALSGMSITDEASLNKAGFYLLEQLGSPFVVITRGKDGMAIFSRGRTKPVLIPTYAREVFDVSGAGDTVIATMALAMVSGAEVVDAAVLANYAAGVEVGKRGTATVSRDELRHYVKVLTGARG